MFKIHGWLGTAFGGLILIQCITGAILVFAPHDGSASGFFMAVERLHRFLLMSPSAPDGMSVGRFLMGASAIALTLILLTGIYLWWPKSKKMLKNRLTINTKKGQRRFIYDSHVSLGIYSSVFLFLMSLTAPFWSFKWYHDLTTLTIGYNNAPLFVKSLHTGLWAGWLTKAIWLLAAIAGAWLTLSGYYLWLKRAEAKKKSQLKT